MTISSKTLSAIQKAGAAVFAADAELKKAVAVYADEVNSAMTANPFGLGNDTLFQNWKVAARLAQTVSAMEEELKSVHLLATDMLASAQPRVHEVLTLAAPKPSVKKMAKVKANAEAVATDVLPKVKKTTKQAKPKARALKGGTGAKKADRTPGKTRQLAANPAALMVHLESILNQADFVDINYAQAAQATGLPSGSVAAAIKKLVALGRIVRGQSGHYKLPEGSYHIPVVEKAAP